MVSIKIERIDDLLIRFFYISILSIYLAVGMDFTIKVILN